LTRNRDGSRPRANSGPFDRRKASTGRRFDLRDRPGCKRFTAQGLDSRIPICGHPHGFAARSGFAGFSWMRWIFFWELPRFLPAYTTAGKPSMWAAGPQILEGLFGGVSACGGSAFFDRFGRAKINSPVRHDGLCGIRPCALALRSSPAPPTARSESPCDPSRARPSMTANVSAIEAFGRDGLPAAWEGGPCPRLSR